MQEFKFSEENPEFHISARCARARRTPGPTLNVRFARFARQYFSTGQEEYDLHLLAFLYTITNGNPN
jgi:hypothetical protein